MRAKKRTKLLLVTAGNVFWEVLMKMMNSNIMTAYFEAVKYNCKRRFYSMKTIDARGLSCPEPVIRTKNALASGEKAYTVMVDNVTAKENVSRFALHQGYKVSVKEEDEDFILTLEK